MLTERLTINILERNDIELARKLHNDSSTLNSLTDPHHVSELEQEEWFKKLSLSKSSMRYAVYERLTKIFVGIFRVDMIDYINKIVIVGLDITALMQNRKFSFEIYECFFDYFFNTCGFNRIHLLVLETNEKAIHIYKKLGFKEEGRQRQAVFRQGKYVDYIGMSILANEYREKFVL